MRCYRYGFFNQNCVDTLFDTACASLTLFCQKLKTFLFSVSFKITFFFLVVLEVFT